MDELIRWSLEEIALDGLLGCSPPDLYQILESEHKAVLDGFKKKKLFEWLLAKSGKELTFYERQKDRPKPKDEKKKTKMLQTKALDDEHVFTELGYTEYAEPANNFDDKYYLVRELKVPTVDEFENPNVLMVADVAIRNYVLGLGKRRDLFVSNVQLGILQIIAHKRRQGALQSSFSQYHGIQAKSAQYHLRRLGALGLIDRRDGYDTVLKIPTNMYYLVKFTPKKQRGLLTKEGDEKIIQDYERYVFLKQTITETVVEMLKKAKDNTLVEFQVRQLVLPGNDKRSKHHWERLRDVMVSSKQIASRYITLVKDDKEIDTRVLQLRTQQEESRDERLEGEQAFIFGIPQLDQMHKYIAEQGSNGILHTDLYAHFGIDTRFSQHLCDILQKEWHVTATAENNGKTNTYRLKSTKSVAYINEPINVENDEAQPPAEIVATQFDTNKKRRRQKDAETERSTIFTEQMAERANILMTMLNEKAVVTRREFRIKLSDHEASKRKEGELVKKIEGKTINRLLEHLEKEQRIKRYTVAVPDMFKTGNKDYMCILKYDTDTNSPIVKDFFKSLKDSSYVHNRRKFEPNATEKVASITNITEVGVPEQIASIVEENKANATEIDVKDKRAIQTEANFNMIVNGYQCARMIRVKHFHQFLCSLAKRDTPTTEFHISDVFGKMSVILYLNIIGCVHKLNLEDYYDQEGIISTRNDLLTCAIERAPVALRETLGSTRSVAIAITRFQAFLTELKKMGVIIDTTEYMEGSRPDTFKKFELVREVYVKNKKHILDANMNLEAFWKDYESTRMATYRKKSQSEDSIRSIRTDWSELRYFTKAQLRLLEDFYKRVPSPDVNQCRILASESGVAFDNVVLYFYRTRNQIIQQDKTTKLRQYQPAGRPVKPKPKKDDDLDFVVDDDAPIIYEDDDDEMDQVQETPIQRHQDPDGPMSLSEFVRKTAPSKPIEPKKKKKEPKKPKKKKKEGDEEKKKKSRHAWTNEEDISLLDQVAKSKILDMNNQTIIPRDPKGVNFTSIGSNLNVTAQAVRMRFATLMKLPWAAIALQLVIAYRDFFGVDTSFEKFKFSPTIAQPISVVLPLHYQDVSRYFKTIILQDEKPELLANETNHSLRIAVLCDIFKMIFLTPEPEFSGRAGHRLFAQFSEEELSMTVQYLQTHHIISRNKERGLKIRQMKMHQNFHNKTKLKAFPEYTFDEAYQFWKKTTAVKVVEDEDDPAEQQPKRTTVLRVQANPSPPKLEKVLVFNEICSGGDIAAVLSMLTSRNLRIIPHMEKITDEQNEQQANSLGEAHEKDEKKSKSGIAYHVIRVNAADGDKEDFVTGEDKVLEGNLKNHMQLPKWAPVLDLGILTNEFHVPGTIQVFEDEETMYRNSQQDDMDSNKRKRDEDDDDDEEVETKKCRFDTAMYEETIKSALEGRSDDYQRLQDSLFTLLLKYPVEDHEECIENMFSLFDQIVEAEDGISKKDTLHMDLLQLLVDTDVVIEIAGVNELRYVAKHLATDFLVTPYRIEKQITAVPEEIVTTGLITCTKAADTREPKYDEDDKAGQTSLKCLAPKRPCSVFRKMTGELNHELIGDFKTSIVEKVMLQPGITRKLLYEEFFVIHKPQVDQLLDLLVHEKILYISLSQVVPNGYRNRNPLFSDDDEPEYTFEESFYPCIDAVIRCSEFKESNL